MKLTAPKNFSWIIALVLALLGLLGQLGVVAALAGFAFWFVFIAAVLLLLATFFSGL